jgi:transglutaminase-like putative cysteine protease
LGAAQGDPLRAVLSDAARFRYVDQNGDQDMDTAIATLSGNCLAMSTLMVSLLRAHPAGPVPAVVALGRHRGFGHETNHAWVLVRDEDARWFLVDPGDLAARPADPKDEEQASLRFYCLFSERGLHPGGSVSEVIEALNTRYRDLY